jgi:hypothetical protein
MSESGFMKRHDTAAFSVLAGILVTLGARPAPATERGCAAPTVEADGRLPARWPDLLIQVHQAFDTRADVDACARIKLTTGDAVVIVEVVLPDGRSAVRTVSHREDVLPALEALLLLPQTSAPTSADEASEAPPPTPAAAAVALVNRAEAVVTAPAREAPSHPSTNSPGHVRVDLSVGAGARIGDGQVGVDLGVLSSLEIVGWLLGFQGHVNRYYPNSNGIPDVRSDGAAALELGVLAGRRLRFQAVALDLVVGPALALHGATISSVQATPSGTTVNQTRSDGPTPRLLASSRLTFGRSALRSFVEVDGEIGERGPSSGSMPLGPQLPAWIVGVAVGAVVGTR